MYKTIKDYFPDPSVLIEMDPAQLAGYVVQTLNQNGTFHPHNYVLEMNRHYVAHPQIKLIQERIMEAFAWLKSEALIIDDFDNQNWYRLSSRARNLGQPTDILKVAKVREALPKGFLHPLVAMHAEPIFNSGKFDTAVFEAFKQVEIAIREATGLHEKDGVDLVREAFRPSNPEKRTASGILTDSTTRIPEQQGIQQLFAGAILSFRNPTGHNNLDIHPQKASELMIIASHLLGIVEDRKQATQNIQLSSVAMLS